LYSPSRLRAYFASEALWTYLTSPFLYTYPGFESEEIEPWHENGEEWRGLKVTFPDHIASHTKTQITHFGPNGLMRHRNYAVNILGGTPAPITSVAIAASKGSRCRPRAAPTPMTRPCRSWASRSWFRGWFYD
jgi:hypothetical protein